MGAPPPARAKPPVTAPAPPAPPTPTASTSPKRERKTFSIKPFTDEHTGEKVTIYGGSGLGKSTLAMLKKGATFIGVDTGARKLRRPDGSPVDFVPGIESWLDLRDALAQTKMWAGRTCVIDTITMVESGWLHPYLIENVPTDKGKKVASMEGYGWGKGFTIALEHMRALLADLDRLAETGVSIILIAQSAAQRIPNAEGLDYIQEGPRLTHTTQASSRQEIVEWSDHVFRIGYLEMGVIGSKDAKVGKQMSDDTTRVVSCCNARHFVAKSRTIETPQVRFESKSDDALWQFLFPGDYPDATN